MNLGTGSPIQQFIVPVVETHKSNAIFQELSSQAYGRVMWEICEFQIRSKKKAETIPKQRSKALK